MDLNDYQDAAQKTAIYPGKGDTLTYPALGLNGEAGEVADKLKKVIRDHHGDLDPATREAIGHELGDCLWYISEMAYELGYSLNTIAIMNIQKLSDRQARGKLGGEGDNR